MNKLKYFAPILIITAAFFAGCSEKFEITEAQSEIDPGDVNFGDTLYVPQYPVWNGFNKPEAMIVGKEPFLYVADTENDRIVMMNLGGEFLGDISVPHPVAIAQDYKLNLIVCGEFDTLGATYGAVYKIDMFAARNNIENAKVKRLLPSTSFDFSRPDRRYTGVASFYDNSFYIARTGPSNASIVDPDNSILIFEPKENGEGLFIKDTLIGRVPQIAATGQGLVSANQISSLTSFDRKNIDMIVTLRGENSFRVQWLTYVVSAIEERYMNKLSTATDILSVDSFKGPEGTDVDEANNIYVADAITDSIYKFNSFGDLLQAFGGESATYEGKPLDAPHDVAFFDRTLYVVDTNNDRILRFILSTELE